MKEPATCARCWLRWAYAVFLALAVFRIPARTGFVLRPLQCDMRLDVALAAESVAKWSHLVLFAAFFAMTWAVLSIRTWPRFAIAMGATFVLGALVELQQGMTRTGNCRARDLLPDAAGGLTAFIAILAVQAAWTRSRRAAQ